MRRLGQDQAGNVAFIGAGCAFAIAIGAGFAMNMNRMETTGDYLQRVADSAALGAVVVGQDKKKADDQVEAAGHSLAASMLVGRPGAPSVVVDVVSRDPTRVSVAINEDVPMIFGGLFERSRAPMLRQATAVSQLAQPICLLILNPTQPETLRLQGSPDIKTNACSVQVNSKAAKAITVGDSASIDASAIHVSGPPSPDRRMKPKPQYNQPVLEDPLKVQIAWPALAACDHVGYQARGGSETIKPGVYCGGMAFRSGANVTLAPGLYVVQTGSISFAANSKVSGPSGVTVVLLDPIGSFSLQGGPDVNLQAPESGPWKGIVLAVKPQPLKITSSLQGGGDLTLGGVVYMPSQHLEMRGGSNLGGVPLSRGFVVDTLNMQGSGAVQLAGDDRLMGQQRNARLTN